MTNPASPITVPSMFRSGTLIRLDPWSLNPLADDAQQAAPDLYRLAIASGGEPPKMFGAGLSDLPAFTASGVDPQHLLLLPALARHEAAAAPDAASVLGMIEENGADPHYRVDGPPLIEAIKRMSGWLGGKWLNPVRPDKADATEVAAAENDLLDRLFGEQQARDDAHRAAVNNQAAALHASLRRSPYSTPGQQ